MDILFLGTSAGLPTKARNVTATALLEAQGKGWYLIDCGEGTQHQLLHTSLSEHALRGIFITHVHGDHCYGLPGLLSSAGMKGRTEPLTIVAPRGIQAWIEAAIMHTQFFLPYELKFVAVEDFAGDTFGEFSVQTVSLSHRVPSYAYVFVSQHIEHKLQVEKLLAAGVPKGPLWGQLQSGHDVVYQGTSFCYTDFVTSHQRQFKAIICGDNDTPELLDEAGKDCDVLVHEATYTEEIGLLKAHYGHSYAAQVARFAESANIPNLLLTHISSRYQDDITHSPSIADILSEAQSVYSGHVSVVRDFERYRLDHSGVVTLVPADH
ncbi:Ribonuclease Z [Vibrio mangrovi]|nr:Ribonuclease Z [Vibrio mangrovi]